MSAAFDVLVAGLPRGPSVLVDQIWSLRTIAAYIKLIVRYV